jgi:cell pole-organizing protein PopZ
MAEQATKEPTMEEILSSIRRIISEDGNPVGEASGSDVSAADADDDFLGLGDELAGAEDEQVDVTDGDHLLSVDELLDSGSEFTDFESLADIDALSDVPEVESVQAESTLQEVFDASALDQSVAEIEASVFADDTVSAAPSTHAEAEATSAHVTAAVETMQEDPAPESVAAAPQPIVQEAATVTEPTSAAVTAAAPLAAAGVASNPIEQMVSEMMRPMIKEWIDTNLPGIVERKVEAEIQQVANKVVAALRND